MTAADRCSIAGCDAKHYARGLCNKHYQRVRARSSTKADGVTYRHEAERFYEDVVLHFNDDACLIWPYAAPSDQPILARGEKRLSVRRLVCEAARGPPADRDHMALPSCDDPLCVSKQHLRWTLKTRENDRRKALSEADVLEIRLLASTLSQSEIAIRFAVNKSTISRILRRKSRTSI